jgi:hypothetical protein
MKRRGSDAPGVYGTTASTTHMHATTVTATAVTATAVTAAPRKNRAGAQERQDRRDR